MASDEPTFRYRGWFINDEDLLTEWFGDGGRRDIAYRYYHQVTSPKATRHVFEALLRLQCNLVIPASFVDIRNPAEERLVRMALDGVEGVRRLSFDLPRRTLTVWHEGTPHLISEKLGPLGLGAALSETEPARPGEASSGDAEDETEANYERLRETAAMLQETVTAEQSIITLESDKATMEIEPMFEGIAQVIGVLQAIDSGVCDE